MNSCEDNTVQVYRARLRQDNRKVHVVRYCRPDSFQIDVARLKKNWHPNVRPLLGYSRSDPVASFIVTDAQDTRPWEEVLMSVQGSTRIRYYLQAVRTISCLQPTHDLTAISFRYSLYSHMSVVPSLISV